MLKRMIYLFIFLSFVENAYATSVFYEGANISGSLWEYNYSVENNTLGSNINEFSVFFDPGLYTNLVTSITPTGWNALVLQPDLLIPDDGIYDALSLGIGITPSSTVSGFTVRFNFLGTGLPSAQPFNIVDPVTFSTLDSGTTMLRLSSAPVTITSVPTLSEWMLFVLSGLIVYLTYVNRRVI